MIDGFNPHTHEGCDQQQGKILLTAQVSIHTPTKGVTYQEPREHRRAGVSIHTPTKGVTPVTTGYAVALKIQSTHPRRV